MSDKPSTELSTQSTRSALADPFMPNSMEELRTLGTMISNSVFAPASFKGKAEDCMVAIMYGRELGVSPLQALQGVAVINGRPGVFGDLMWALIVSHPEYQDCTESVTPQGATVTLTRRGKTPYTVAFTQADAQTAGLWKKQGPWTNYSERMMLWRARTFAARFLFPDALKGLTSIEELNDYIEGEVITPDSLREQHREAAALHRLHDESKTQEVAAAASTETVSKDEIKELTDTYKANGWKANNVRAKMNELYGDKVDRTGLIPKARFSEIMAWAKTKKGDAAAAIASADAAPAQETPFDDPKPAEDDPEEKIVRSQFIELQISLFEQTALIDRFTADGKTNWTELVKELGKRMR